MHDAQKNDVGWRVPSDELEKAVAEGIREFLNDEPRLIEAVGLKTGSPVEIRRTLRGAKELAARIGNEDPLRCYANLRRLVRRVTLGVDRIRIAISRRCLSELIGAEDNVADDDDADDDDADISLDLSIALRRRGVESKIVLPASASSIEWDDNLIFLVARTRRWFDRIVKGETTSIREIARDEDMDEGDVSRFLPLAFLAPDIVETILAGKQPTEITAEKLKRLRFLPYAWKEQRQLLGFHG